VRVKADASQIIDYAKYIGVDPLKEPWLLKVAEEGLLAALPDGWSEHEDQDGNIFYFCADSNQSTWTHPLDNFYKAKVLTERMKRQRRNRDKSRKGGAHEPTSVTTAMAPDEGSTRTS